MNSLIQKINTDKFTKGLEESLQEVKEIKDGKRKVDTLDDMFYRLEHPSLWDRLTTPFSRFSYKIEQAYWNAKYAIQRVKQGYDSRDIFAFCDKFPERMAKILIEFKRYNVGVWQLFDDNNKHVRALSDYEQDLVLNEMIQDFTYADETILFNTRYSQFSKLCDENDKYYEQHRSECEDKMNECEKDAQQYCINGLKLLTKWYWQIWY